jgi:PhoD-like phosphatase
VETAAPTEVEVLGHRVRTFHVEGHHYALLLIENLQPGAVHPYEVRLDGHLVWPPSDGRPGPAIHTREGERQARLVFGSCRVGAPESAPYTRAPADDPAGLGVDALWAYSRKLQEGDAQWPDGLLLLGDQVYADEVPPEIATFIRARRDVREPPGEEIADFEEYTKLYRETWSDPDIRWLLSTVPTTMIFDDHDVNDDWNISQSWVEEMRSLPWWDERITGAFMAYWLYQHLGNLSPPELAEETLFRQVQQDDDAGPRLRAFARMRDRESAASRWAYYRDFGRSRLLVIDSRAARVLADGRRDMIDADEWDWIAQHAHGSFDHLILATTLPAFMPHGIHHLEAWSEAVCDGRWGSLAARLGERVRRAVDLEHWAAFQRSFEQLADLLRDVSRGLGGEPPATVTILSGDVHMTYVARIDLGADAGPCRVNQVVCSPFRNPLTPLERRVMKATGSRAAATVFSTLARACRVPAPSASWKLLSRPTYDNSIGELVLDERTASVTISRTTSEEDGHLLKVVHVYDLSAGPDGSPSCPAGAK